MNVSIEAPLDRKEWEGGGGGGGDLTEVTFNLHE